MRWANQHLKNFPSQMLRAFPTHFGHFLYFTSSKSHFFSLQTHFYITPLIPFSILQYILLKYYKIIIFFFFFPCFPNPSLRQHQPTATNPRRNPQPQTHARILSHKPTQTANPPLTPPPLSSPQLIAPPASPSSKTSGLWREREKDEMDLIQPILHR